jgi:hypothetical protein
MDVENKPINRKMLALSLIAESMSLFQGSLYGGNPCIKKQTEKKPADPAKKSKRKMQAASRKKNRK